MDLEAPNVHPDDRLRVLQRLVAIVGDLDAAGLAALADPHLGLDHARIADLLGGLDRRLDSVSRAAIGHGHAVFGEELLSLIFEEIHGGRGRLSKAEPGPETRQLP